MPRLTAVSHPQNDIEEKSESIFEKPARRVKPKTSPAEYKPSALSRNTDVSLKDDAKQKDKSVARVTVPRDLNDSASKAFKGGQSGKRLPRGIKSTLQSHRIIDEIGLACDRLAAEKHLSTSYFINKVLKENQEIKSFLEQHTKLDLEL